MPQARKSVIAGILNDKPPAVEEIDGGRRGWMNPAMTDFRAVGTIIGLAGLTAVFGMGTGVAPPVWSPEKHPAGG